MTVQLEIPSNTFTASENDSLLPQILSDLKLFVIMVFG